MSDLCSFSPLSLKYKRNSPLRVDSPFMCCFTLGNLKNFQDQKLVKLNGDILTSCVNTTFFFPQCVEFSFNSFFILESTKLNVWALALHFLLLARDPAVSALVMIWCLIINDEITACVRWTSLCCVTSALIWYTIVLAGWWFRPADINEQEFDAQIYIMGL